MLEHESSINARNIILTAAAFWVAGTLTGRSLDAPTADASMTSMTALQAVPDVPKRIQGNLHGMLGLAFEQHILNKVQNQITMTLSTFPTVDLAAIGKTQNDAEQVFTSFFNNWKWSVYAPTVWQDNTAPTNTVQWALAGNNIDAMVKPAVITDLKTRLRASINTKLQAKLGQPLTPTLINEVAQSTTGEASASIGDWVCIYNPETGSTDWYNQQTGEWGGAS